MVDLAIIGLFLLAIRSGYRKGFIGQAIGLVGIVLSLLIAYSFSQDTAVFLQKQFPLPHTSSYPPFQTFLGMPAIHKWFYLAVSFFLVFIFARILCRVTGSFLQSLAELPLISIMNSCLGGCVGVLKVVALVLIVVQLTPLMPDNWQGKFDQSVIAQYAHDHSSRFTKQLPEWPKRAALREI
ncbi:hypothetical protein BEP19_05160 [Ammoniphilus oxalaticus]|uniref:Colicin V production protein n=1 Tax=Ammoniphilus oxalaticus TaxID=66863 RepID=A0A419SIN7_9BACL|nr:CvpA family protein [Ammoniphilus oxalaticus]RKD23819.1 hypothetical protein BEP19_05160 [Ammoniphilus oxalaticus]